MSAGYYRFPTIYGDTIVFVSEDDLWSVSSQGGVARRLTSNMGEVTYPSLSPDGDWLAFVGKEEGTAEVYVMPAHGGSARRLTYQSSRCRVLGWAPDGAHIIYSSNYGQVIHREYGLFRVAAHAANGHVEPLPYGPAQSVSFGPNGQVVLGRNTGDDPARWKRYRGGTAGHLWIDHNGDGEFLRLLADLPGNMASPMWIASDAAGTPTGGNRIFFASDHEGVGNLYSCLPDGNDLRRHTDHEDYYVRNPTTDGKRIVYHVGADLFVFDVASDQEARIEVEYRSPRIQRNRRFVDAGRFFNSATLHPNGRAMALTTRGKFYAFFNHDGPVIQLGKRSGVRYRLPDWLHDQRSMLVVSDELGEETLEIHTADPQTPPRRLEGLDLGRAVDLKISPVQDKVAIANHRHELLIVDIPSAEVTVVDRSPYRLISGFDWSPDGRWLAYGFSATTKTTEIRLYRLADPDAKDPTLRQPSTHSVTRPVLRDVRPTFDPDGRYLYFLSYREFNPVYDSLHFDLGFPWGVRPYLLTLRADLPHPFIPHPELEEEEAAPPPKPAEEPKEEGDEEEGDEPTADSAPAADEAADGSSEGDEAGNIGDENGDENAEQTDGSSAEAPAEEKSGGDAQLAKKPENGARPLRIDLEGIEQRILPFPVPDGRYTAIAGVPGKALFTQFPVHGSLTPRDRWDDEEPEQGTLRAYNFKEFRTETLVEPISWFELSRNRKKMLYGAGRRLRVINAGEKPPSESGHSRRTGWIDLGRVKVSVNPQSEWEQMFREAWRLQRDHFWTEDMADVDWQIVYQRYFPLIARVSTRSEFSDLMWEMQGELGTSHAYEMGGDYRWPPYYSQGFLGASLMWDAAAGGYRVGEPIIGDPWNADATSPLAGPGIDVRAGDLLIAINGQPLDDEISPAQLLVNQAGQEVLLTFAPRPGEPAGAPPKAAADTGAPIIAAEAEAEAKPSETQGSEPPAKPVTARNRSVVVRAIHSEQPARYRAWVEGNRRRVREASQGRVGYVHIPDMGAPGYAEFHRGYLAEVDCDALIVDVRYNGGGHVSELILEKLARRRIGYDYSRWGGPTPYPSDSVAGPIVAITNEHAGSDGDIFSHSFKVLKLGPLIGKRTWGGVIGISPRHALVDGTMTTQPEYSFWFEDVGWNVENYGVEPDIEVDITPQDYVQGRDPQLERAITEIVRLLAETPVRGPDLSQRPSRALPRLPPRTPVDEG
ncbi:MAG: PDZ domain-containing protein [Caldilineaceae bacterium]|nr:PDZ domain-containing protein [Caldilineaceae bacterium]